MLNLPEKQEVKINAQDLKKMKNLRMLIVRNAEFFGGHVHLPSNLRLLDWEEYPSPCLPSDFLPEKIVMLELRHSHLTLDKPFKGFQKASKFEVIAPRPRILMPFNYHSKGGSMSFWIGQKFPRIALCFIFGLGNKRTDASKAEEVMIYSCGVHEYKEDEEMEKPNLILCTSSSPNNTKLGCNDYFHDTQFSRESPENQCQYDDTLGIDCCSLPENLRLYEISHEKIQQLSASINPEMLEGNDYMAQNKGNTTYIMLADTRHQSKEMSSLHLQLYGDSTWDPMLLECQLNCMNENQLVPNYCHTSENKGKRESETEVDLTLARALIPPTKAGAKAYENVVLKEDLESREKIRMKTDDIHMESQGKPELSENSCSLRERKENSWHHAEAARAVTSKSEPTQKVPPIIIHLADNIMLADQEPEPKGSPVLEYEAKGNEVVLIPMEHNTCQFDISLRDDNMEAFYAALHAETYAPPSPLALGDTRDDSKLAYPQMSEETKKALEILKEFLSNQFCHLLQPASSSSMKTTLDYLYTLFADEYDDVSLSVKSLTLQLSADFTQWSWDYIDASMKLESSTAGLSKLDTLEESLKANKNQFIEFVSIENELGSQLAYLEERMKELEEQINAIKSNISISTVARDTALGKKRETFEAGRVLKAQRDELRKRRPRLRAELESAKATKANIEDEWSNIREKFDRLFNMYGLDY
ncbi:putative TMV resistance protein N-like [Sesbania bispinosa]|nr:putative TMV resistance protein N-like [Sesbania bispinosa]